MKHISKSLSMFAVAGLIVLASSCGGSKKNKDEGADTLSADSSAAEQPKTIVDVAMSDTRFSILVDLIKTANLADMLSDTTVEYTVFAPTNKAFEALGKSKIDALKEDVAKLKNILAYHVVKGKYDAVAVQNASSLKTALGKELPITTEGANVMAGNGNLISTDIMADNGIIHVVDAVLMPEEDKKPSRSSGNDSEPKSKKTAPKTVVKSSDQDLQTEQPKENTGRFGKEEGETKEGRFGK